MLVSKMSQWSQYLSSFQCADRAQVTHTRIPGPGGIHGGKYHIPDEEMDNFYKMYVDHIVFRRHRIPVVKCVSRRRATYASAIKGTTTCAPLYLGSAIISIRLSIPDDSIKARYIEHIVAYVQSRATISLLPGLSLKDNSNRLGPQKELNGALNNRLIMTPNLCPREKSPT